MGLGGLVIVLKVEKLGLQLKQAVWRLEPLKTSKLKYMRK